MQTATISPAQLRCEFLTDPLGIDVAQPRLSWIVQSDRRGAVQSAYQILVGSEPGRLREGHADAARPHLRSGATALWVTA